MYQIHPEHKERKCNTIIVKCGTGKGGRDGGGGGVARKGIGNLCFGDCV